MSKFNKTNSHSELVSASNQPSRPEVLTEGTLTRFFGCCPQNDVVPQQGRSMVEMLGVLAVIGVLSVAGIAGYTAAMNRHRANELLNEASKRAVVVAGQLLNRDKGNLNEFTNNNVAGATFATGEITPSNGQFAITFTTSPDATICAQMKTIAGDNSAMTIATDCSSITFKNDLSKGGSNGGGESPACTLTASDCASGSLASEGCACAPATNNQTCTSHTTNQCGLGYYCQFSPSKCGDSDRGNGVCTAISGGTEVDGHWVGPGLDWWSANSWCIGKGSSGLITYATLQSVYGCDKDTGSCDWTTMNDKGLTGYYWSAEDYGDSCLAWAVYIDEFYSSTRDGDNYALCE